MSLRLQMILLHFIIVGYIMIFEYPVDKSLFGWLPIQRGIGVILKKDVLIENTFILNGEYFLAWVFCAEGYVLDGVGFGELPFDEFAVFLELDFLVLEFECDLDATHGSALL